MKSKKIKEIIGVIQKSAKAKVALGVASAVLLTGVIGGVVAYNNHDNKVRAEQNQEIEETEADIILTENESGELIATDKDGNVVASGEEVEKLVEEKKEKGETIVAKTEDGSTVKVDKVEGDKVTSSGGETVKPSPKPPVIADKPSDGGSNNNNNNNNNNKPSEPSKPTQPEKPVEPEKPTKPVEPEKPTKPVEPEKPTKPIEPEKPTYPSKGFDKTLTDKFNARMLDQGFAQGDSYSGMSAYTAIKNYALNRTPIPTNKLVNESWGCKATGKVLTFTDTFKYSDDPAIWSRSLNSGKLAGCNDNYQTIFANYAVCNSNGDGTFTVTVYALDMTDL